LRHYQRWHKTIRWCQPVGYASQIIINPLLGWFAAGLIFPNLATVWLGLLLQYGVEVLAVLLLARRSRPRSFPAAVPLLALALWPALRTATWLASWLPIPVRWRDRHWQGLQQSNH
jgi:hypothetical protein